MTDTKTKVLDLIRQITPRDRDAAAAAHEKWKACAKPLGSLGLLEEQVESLCALTGTLTPSLKNRTAVIFCADNGVVEEGVTQTGSEVTRLVSVQLAKGRSSVNRMSSVAGAKVLPVDIGMAPNGTANLRKGPAMTETQMYDALFRGLDLVIELK